MGMATSEAGAGKDIVAAWCESGNLIAARVERVGGVRSTHWSPYDRVRVVNADPLGLYPSHLSAHPSLSISAHDAFQLQLTPFNSTPTFACMERP